MKNPVKIIHKFKNNNRRIQYKIYIFIGSQVPKNIMEILDNFSQRDFFTTMNTLSQKDYKIIEEYYGKNWYDYFFTNHHISNQREMINSTGAKKKLLEIKYGKDWIKTHISEPKLAKTTYSYANLYYYNQLLKGKVKTQTRKVEPDFRTFGDVEKLSITDIEQLEKEATSFLSSQQTGGGAALSSDEEIDEDELEEQSEELEEVNEVNEEVESNEPVEVSAETFDEQVEEELDIEDIGKFYQTDADSKKITNDTAKLISEAINDKKWEKQVAKLEENYDGTLEDLTYDVKMEDVFSKHYIKSQYIFLDDTIKTMRQKIAVSIPISSKFGKSIRLLPESQYFWSEYNYKNKNDQIMIGQKWIRRNELLKIDIIPNENLKIYEKLRNNLGYLKESFGHKIKRDDEESNTIDSYEEFMTNNEIYMLDIYNELGIGYNSDAEEVKNLYDVYINIYFPMITLERLEQIILLNNGKGERELSLIENQFLTLSNDIKLESEIQNIVEETKLLLDNQETKQLEKFNKLFNDNNVMHSIIYINLQDPKNITGTTSEFKFNLYRIFDNWIVDETYPFIQFQTSESQSTYKFYDKNIENKELLSKWFVNIPWGLSFKIKMNDDKYLSISLLENGRLEYSITWKEEDKATIDDIDKTYKYIVDLIEKINKENKHIKIINPSKEKYKYAFINTIQQFGLPDDIAISHNDLSDFARYFFPYVAVVIDPNKRKSASQSAPEFSKFGTYLRYKRISKFDNRVKIHMRILYFLINYDITEKELIDEIAKQFNITIDISTKELDYVKDKYAKYIKKTKKNLKKLKTLPRAKPPGIGVDFQGKEKNNYKVKIAGARNKNQLMDIEKFIKVLMFLYIQSYHYKNKEYTKLRDTLKTLNKIARRRNKVIDVIDEDTTKVSVKEITSLDKERLGYRPEEGQDQWTRLCQNSGKDNKRRPDIIPENNVNQLISQGYKLNKTTGNYEKQIEMKVKGKTLKATVKAVKLTGSNGSYNYFTCNPETNGEQIYLGFLSKGSNPNDLCMPCCFKKDHEQTTNKTKRAYYMKCTGGHTEKVEPEQTVSTEKDKIYILKKTFKVQEGRFIILPEYLDIFFNKLFKREYKTKKFYLSEAKNGYFLKYTIKPQNNMFLNVLCNIFNKTEKELLKTMTTFLENDKINKYYNWLNSGDIAETFNDKKDYIKWINTSSVLDYDTIGELTELPNVITKSGIAFFIFHKFTQVVKKTLEKDEIKHRYYLLCLNPDNYDIENIKNKDIVILIKDGKNYFPIYMVLKNDNDNKPTVIKSFDKTNTIYQDVLNELFNYQLKSCDNSWTNGLLKTNVLNCKKVIKILENKKLKVQLQYVDERHKCRYIKVDNMILPVNSSGIDNNYDFTNSDQIKFDNYETSIKNLENIENKINLDYKPVQIFYDSVKSKTDNDMMVNVSSIELLNGLILPTSKSIISKKSINNKGLVLTYQPLEETIDDVIMNAPKDDIDTHKMNVLKHKFDTESFNMFRLELSNWLDNDKTLKEQIINIVRNKTISNEDKRIELRRILFDLIDPKLSKEYKLSINSDSKSVNKNYMTWITNSKPDLKKYVMTNIRELCQTKTQSKCELNLQCAWDKSASKCKLKLEENLAIDIVNRVVEQMILDNIEFKEIIQEGDYWVSDIIDYSQFTNRENQKIVKVSSLNITKLMEEIFGKDKIPKIGKKKVRVGEEVDIDTNQPKPIEFGNFIIQQIISNKDSILRAWVNSYYWLLNPLYDMDSRNLGYESLIQTQITYLLKAYIIDWIQTMKVKGTKEIKAFLEKHFKTSENFFESTLNKYKKSGANTNGKIELYVLSHIIPKPIVIYDNFSNVIGLYLQGDVELSKENIKEWTKPEKLANSIIIRFDYLGDKNIPKNIYAMYM